MYRFLSTDLLELVHSISELPSLRVAGVQVPLQIGGLISEQLPVSLGP